MEKTKKSEKDVNIKPMIYDMREQDGKVYMLVATGSVENLKPELVMQAFWKIPWNRFGRDCDAPSSSGSVCGCGK